MFEKCGVMDILYALRKYAVAIIAVMAACFVLGLSLTVVTADTELPAPPVEPADPPAPVEEWVASACYQITTRKGADVTVEEQQLADDKAAATLLALVKADFTRVAVYDELLKTYTKNEIVEAFDLTVKAEDLTQFDLSYVLEGALLKSTSVINIYLQSKNKELSDDYLALIKEQLAAHAASMDNVSLTFCGGVLSAMKIPAPQEEAPTVEEDPYVVSVTKYWLILPLLALVLAVLAVVFKAMFFPTVNRRSAVAAYDLPVVAEIDRRAGKTRAMRSIPFNACALADLLKDQHVRTCAVVTTLKNTALVQQTLTDMAAALQQKGRTMAVASSLDDLPETDFESALVFAGNLNTNLAALEEASRCDRVLLVEQYGTTTHRSFYEAHDILQLKNCDLIGVATVR